MADAYAIKCQGPDTTAGSNPILVSATATAPLGIGIYISGTLTPLPVEGANADNRSPQNIPAGAAFQYAYNDTLGGWDRRRNNVASTPLVTQTGSVATRNSADLVNYNGRGIALHVKVANLANAPTFTPRVQWKDN